MILAIDPGIRGCGAAVFDGTALHWAGYVRNTATTGNGPFECASMADAVARELVTHTVTRLVLEWPQIYRAGKGKGDPNDLLCLAGVDAALAGWFRAPGTHVRPRAWKGTIDGDKLIKRIKMRVTPAERLCVVLPCPSLEHNVWDAIGLGLWAVGRLTRTRIYPGASPSTKEA